MHSNKGTSLLKERCYVIYKHSRYAYTKSHGLLEDQEILEDDSLYAKELKRAHLANLQAIDDVTKILKTMGIDFTLMCRSELAQGQIIDGFIISVGGDGTLLDISHHVHDAPILGLNSDPKSSVGALLCANTTNLTRLLHQIDEGTLLPTALNRMTLRHKPYNLLSINDLFFSHKNPSATSRFIINYNGATEEHRSSGIWVSTAAGSTGAILSAGAEPLDLCSTDLLFRVREPCWSSTPKPQLMFGRVTKSDEFSIISSQPDQSLYLDGPHKFVDLRLLESSAITNASLPLMLFVDDDLIKRRISMINKRQAMRASR